MVIYHDRKFVSRAHVAAIREYSTSDSTNFILASSLRYYTESIIVVTASTCRGIELLSTLSTLCSLHKPTIYVCIVVVVVVDVISSYSLVWGLDAKLIALVTISLRFFLHSNTPVDEDDDNDC